LLKKCIKIPLDKKQNNCTNNYGTLTPNSVEDINIRRLGWVGHTISMEEERIPKRVLNGNFHTTRPVRRPRTRWADVV
jgi:hypothetical protein